MPVIGRNYNIMKILWITNTLFPDVCKHLDIPTPVVGGWMFAGAKSLINSNLDVKLAIATLYKGREFQQINLDGISYFLIPESKNKSKINYKLEKNWKSVQKEFMPDIIHIHGSEYPHGLAYVQACGNKNVVLSLQGLISAIEKYYFGGVSKTKLFKYITIRDIIRNDTIFSQRKKMIKRGRLEKTIINSIEHIIGRTKWDNAHSWAINPDAKYHFCNESLRENFHGNSWNLGDCEKYSIFLSQAYYPLKGLQQIVKALPLIIKQFPDVKVYVAGNDFITNKGWRINGFGKYIKFLIKENNVEKHILFTGLLNPDDMKNRYLRSHVFVCPSAIENSSNSIGEAQLLGVPCVASYVGGIADMITDHETGLLYRFEETEMLAKSVCSIFETDKLTLRISAAGKKAAEKRHNNKVNSNRLISIYKEICNK